MVYNENVEYDENSSSFEDTGYIAVEVFTGKSAFPVENASVVISEKIDGKRNIVKQMTTDRNGKTPAVAVKTPSRVLSETQNDEQVYGVYQVSITHPEFYAIESIPQQVFGGIVSIARFELIPLPQNIRMPEGDAKI